MQHVLELIQNALAETLVAISHNWPYLLASILVAAALKAFADPAKVAGFLQRWKGRGFQAVGVLAATGAAVTTPFCSCGTTAVTLGMMASAMSLAPIVAFMVASPLSSPEELFYSAGLFGWPFALFHFGTSIALGLLGGAIAALLERRGLLAGQTRFAGPAVAAKAEAGCSCGTPKAEEPRAFRQLAAARPLLAASGTEGACGCGSAGAGALPGESAIAPDCGCGVAEPPAEGKPGLPARLRDLGRETRAVAVKILPLFVGFAFIGYLLNSLIPSTWISGLFGTGRVYGVPLAATIGLPLYLSSEASLPLVRGLLDSGMSQGAIMAFLIAGSGTSVGAITGALTIARWKVVGLVVAVLWAGAILAGYAFDLLLAGGIA